MSETPKTTPAPAPLPGELIERVIPTHTPAANLAARDNIVPDGPGTVGDFLE